MASRQDAELRRRRAEESERVAALHELGLLDSPPQERFDRITRLLQDTFQVPIARINFIDEDRQYTKSPQEDGQSPNYPREHSFCEVTIQTPGILIVPDALKDERFSWKESVTGDAHVRFYAGYSLQSGGHRVGTLCVADTAPREFSAADQAVLARMGRWVETEMERHAPAHVRQASPAAASRHDRDRLRSPAIPRPPADAPVSTGASTLPHDLLATALATSSEAVIVLDVARNIVFANEAAQNLTGYSESDLLGRSYGSLQAKQTGAATVARIDGSLAGETTFHGPTSIFRADGREVWTESTITPVRDGAGRVSHFVGVHRDITEVVTLRDNVRVQLERADEEGATARLLLHVARLLGDHSDVGEVTDVIAQGIRDICAADRSAVASWDAPSGRLRMRAHSGWPTHLTDKVATVSVLTADLPELAALTATGRSVTVGSGASWPLQRSMDDFEVAAFVAVPIRSFGDLRGMLFAYWADAEPSSLSDSRVERLEGLSHLAGVALETSR